MYFVFHQVVADMEPRSAKDAETWSPVGDEAEMLGGLHRRWSTGSTEGNQRRWRGLTALIPENGAARHES
ncbi:MAG: hypothetical protein AVDCRST_MAG19-4603 [uncultured Thermomicrobiales bacterium]|uniref:Uncharacterized protein n=1 Tax=uncultured Thermomicrobiales bacterium TaxID=1645740 RepID=A0A6J4VPX4_9BACT|nr:MAG: hypothetical protein AVDCRST_MAG19-4603 [uncultured Thermomicrobiales bacterium]